MLKLKDVKSVKKTSVIPLSEYFEYKRGDRLKQSDRIMGDVPLVTAGFQNDGIADYISNGIKEFSNAITIDMFGNVFWRPYTFYCDDNIIVLTSEYLNESTAHFYLSSIINDTSREVYDYNKQFRLKHLEEHYIELPLKNDEVDYQMISQISEILSKISELEAELEARQSQYEYYRNKLLTFDKNNRGGVINMYIDYVQPTKYIVKKAEYSDEYRIPVLTAGKTFILGYTDETKGIYNATPDNPCMIFDDFTTSFHWVDFPFKVKSSALKILVPKTSDMNFKFLYYLMRKIDYKKAEGVHQRHWISKYSKLEIWFPELEEQNRIVDVLDNFYLLTSSLQDGLPAEIDIRNQQYKYYRKELLNFGSEV